MDVSKKQTKAMKNIIPFIITIFLVSCSENTTFTGQKIETVFSTVLIAEEHMDFENESIMEDDQTNRKHLREFAENIMNKVKAGELKAYSTIILDQELDPQTLAEVWVKHDTLYIQEGLSFREVPIVEEFDITDITHLRFKENWYYDENNNMIAKEVVEVCPVSASFDEKGEYRGKVPLFWIKL